MAVTVNITHDVSGLSEYTSTSGADISIGSGLAGTMNGLLILVDDNVADYGQITLAGAVSGTMRYRFYYDPNSFTVVTDYTGVMLLRHNCSATPWSLVGIDSQKNGAQHIITVELFQDDPGASKTIADKSITDAPHYIELLITRAATNISADGTSELWIDGVSQGTATGIDNYDLWALCQNVRLGRCTGGSATVAGTIYLDELIINDDGGLIGPRTSDAALGAKAFGYQFPTLGETGVSWTTFDNGSGGAITVSGDPNWGKGELDIGEEMRSAVEDLGNIATRTFTLTPNRYGTGSGTATLQYRGQDAVFVQDDNVLAWTTYTVPFALSCRYFQIREIKSS